MTDNFESNLDDILKRHGIGKSSFSDSISTPSIAPLPSVKDDSRFNDFQSKMLSDFDELLAKFSAETNTIASSSLVNSAPNTSTTLGSTTNSSVRSGIASSLGFSRSLALEPEMAATGEETLATNVKTTETQPETIPQTVTTPILEPEQVISTTSQAVSEPIVAPEPVIPSAPTPLPAEVHTPPTEQEVAQVTTQTVVQTSPQTVAPIQTLPAEVNASDLLQHSIPEPVVDDSVVNDFNNIANDIDALIANLANNTNNQAASDLLSQPPTKEETTAQSIESGLAALSVPQDANASNAPVVSVLKTNGEILTQRNTDSFEGENVPEKSVVSDTLRRVAEKIIPKDEVTSNEITTLITEEKDTKTPKEEQVDSESSEEDKSNDDNTTKVAEDGKVKDISKTNESDKSQKEDEKKLKQYAKGLNKTGEKAHSKLKVGIFIGIIIALVALVAIAFLFYYHSTNSSESGVPSGTPSTTAPSTSQSSSDSVVDRASPLFFQGGRGYVVFLKVPEESKGIKITKVKFKSNIAGIKYEIRNTTISKPRDGDIIGSGDLKIGENEVSLTGASVLKLLVFNFESSDKIKSDTIITLTEFSVEQ